MVRARARGQWTTAPQSTSDMILLRVPQHSPRGRRTSVASNTDSSIDGVELQALGGGTEDSEVLHGPPGSVRQARVGMDVQHRPLAIPRPTSVFSGTVLQIDPHKNNNRISNKLEINGNMADATTQVDPRAIVAELPSERRLKSQKGYDVRMGMETSMPYSAGLVSARRLSLEPGVRAAAAAAAAAANATLLTSVRARKGRKNSRTTSCAVRAVSGRSRKSAKKSIASSASQRSEKPAAWCDAPAPSPALPAPS